MLWLICVVTVLSEVTGEHPPSCERPIFSYVERREERVGSIRLADPGGTVVLDVLLYTAAQLSTSQNDHGRLEYYASTSSSNGYLRFFLRLPTQEPLPQIGKMTINGRVYCENSAPQGSRALSTSLYSYTLQRQGSPNNNNNNNNTSWQSSGQTTRRTTRPTTPPTTTSERDLCGRPTAPQGNAFGGRRTRRGDWPWIAPLFRGDMWFICGTTIIGQKQVITAAHCLFERDTREQLQTTDLTVGLGSFNITMWKERGVFYRDVRKVYIHDSYDKWTLRSDIAILLLDERVAYTDYIRPICLWNLDTNVDLIVNTNASVVGWGVTESSNNEPSDVPSLVEVPIVPQQTCKDSHQTFKDHMDTALSFCTGTRRGVGPCEGDSGSGLVIQAKDSRRILRWYLRGLVSSGATGNISLCNLDNYSLFTDVAKFATWINDTIEKSNRLPKFESQK